MAGPQPDYGITAVTRTAAIVAVLVRLGPSPLTRLAAEAGCTAPNAFRILHTLCALGLVVQEGKRGPWRLGVGWLPIAQAANDQGALLYCARPMVEAFAQSCGEPVSFLVRDGEQCHVVAAHPSNPPIRAYTAPAVREPLHAGPGRLLLAYAPLRIQHAVLASRMARLGPSTRTDPAWVGADLPRIRARSWLITTDEGGRERGDRQRASARPHGGGDRGAQHRGTRPAHARPPSAHPADAADRRSGGAGQGAGVSGAGDEVRTRDIQIGNLTLYQLSYTRDRTETTHRRS